MQIMPFDEAKTYRFNPFDLTKVWPHADYPLIEVGRMTLNRNPTDNHTEIEQAAFDVSNLVPGIGPSPDKMLLGRIFSYADAHRARIGVNDKRSPLIDPGSVHSYSKDGRMRVENVSDPVYAPNSEGDQRPILFAILRSRYGRRAESSSMPLTRSERTTMTSVRPEPWCARSWTTPHATGWSRRRRPPQERCERARIVTRVRVLAQRRQDGRRQDRPRGQRRTHRCGIAEGRVKYPHCFASSPART